MSRSSSDQWPALPAISRIAAAIALGLGLLPGASVAASKLAEFGSATSFTPDAAAGTDSAARSAPVPVGMRVGRPPGRTRLVFDLGDPTQYRVSTLTQPDRVVIDFSNAYLSAPLAAGALLATPVARVATERRNDHDLRVILDLTDAQGLRLEEFVLKPYAGNGHRLVVDLLQEASAPLADAAPEPAPTPAPASPPGGRPASTGRLHDSPPPAEQAPADDATSLAGSNILSGGYAELAAAYTYPENAHWSQLRARLQVNASGDLGSAMRFRVAGRAQADGAFRLEDDFYPDAVRRNQESEFLLREAYLDFNAGDWEYRLGKQYVVWGEMVGFFLADVVSARDTREFFLPEFESMRIGQWAVRAEHFSGDSHFEWLWIPYVSYDEIGKPGTDFYPYPVPPGAPVNEVTPSRSQLSNTNFGARYSHLLDGWDLSAFYYQSNDVSPTLYTVPTGFELRHDRIDQFGATFSKDYGDFILKGEAVYTTDRGFLVDEPLPDDGVEQSDALNYIVGVMIPRGDWRFDLQFYGQHVVDHTTDMTFDVDEVGITLLANRRFGEHFEAEIIYLTGLNRSDYSWQPSASWNITQTWRLQFGADIFGGSQYGYFGRFDDSDRIFLALRNWF